MADERTGAPIGSEEIDARVGEAADEHPGELARGERIDLPTPAAAPESFAALSSEAALDVDEARRRVPREPEPLPPEPEAPAERSLRRRRLALFLLGLVLLAAGGVVLLAQRPEGEGLLPGEVRGVLRDTTRSVTSRVPGVEAPLYTFTDDAGVVHIVDDLEKVPPKYRAKAKERR